MEVLNLIRKSFLVFGKKFEIFVSGNSMEPMINDGDKIEITYISSCVLGDIIVFEHDETILVHRILKIDNEYVYCKGDNSFRLERVAFDQIIGKVSKVNSRELRVFPMTLIYLSYNIGKIFEKNHSIEKTCNKLQYKIYKKCINQLRKRKG